MVSFDHIRPVFLGWCPFWKLLPTALGPHPPGVAVGPGGTPPSPLVSLSGTNSFGIFGLQVVLAFTRMILNGLRVKVGKHWGYGRFKTFCCVQFSVSSFSVVLGGSGFGNQI